MRKQNPFSFIQYPWPEHGEKVPDAAWVSQYDVIWHEQGEHASDSMPLGDGDTGLNVWTTAEGGLFLLLGRSDTIGHRKMGRIHLSCQPNLFQNPRTFTQCLHLKDGCITVDLEGLHLLIWLDAHACSAETVSVLHLAGTCSQPVTVQAAFELWRPHATYADQFPDCATLPEDAVCEQEQSVSWLQRSMRQGCSHTRLVGGKLSGQAGDRPMVLAGSHAIKAQEPVCRFGLQAMILSDAVPAPAVWQNRLAALETDYGRQPLNRRLEAHQDWWHRFWSQSRIEVTGFPNAAHMTRQHVLQRFIFACSSRGLLPALFNGSIFRYDTPAGAISAFNWIAENDETADMRPWGDAYMGQNTRHQFWPLLATGDFLLIAPLVRLIRGKLKPARVLVWETMGHAGAVLTELFHEEGCTYGPGDTADLPEIRRGCRPDASPEKRFWHLQYHFLVTIEMTVLFAELYRYTEDRQFFDEVLLPLADSCVRFYAEHYPRFDAAGKRVFYPAGTAETYGRARSRYCGFSQQEDVTNPVSEVSGLRYLLSLLLETGSQLLGTPRWQTWSDYLTQLPDVPTKTYHDQELLAPGAQYSPGLTCEANELYAVWPFRQHTFLSSLDRWATGVQSLYARRLSLDGSTNEQFWETGGWHPAAIDAAVLGLPREAGRLLEKNMQDQMPEISLTLGVPYQERPGRPRFPGFWNHPHMDGIPDQCHGGVTLNALQQMLLQCEGDQICLLPAWPDHWDVSFTLHAPRATKISCVYRAGQVVSLAVSPPERLADVVDCTKPEQRFRRLAAVACIDRNELFGLPPMPDGQATMDDFTSRPGLSPWLNHFSESLFQTRAGPFAMQKWGGSVYRDNRIYLHVLEPVARIQLPAPDAAVLAVDVLTGGSASLDFQKGHWLIQLNGCEPPDHVIIKLTLDRPVSPIDEALLNRYCLAKGCQASASSVLAPDFSPDCAVDGKAGTFWSCALDDREPWLAVDLGETRQISRAELHLVCLDLRYGQSLPLALDWDDGSGSWKMLLESQSYGERWAQRFPAVATRRIRVRSAARGIRRIGLFS